MDKEAIRREFEAWFEPDEDNRASLKNWRHGDGYLHSATYLCGCWEGYQAAYLSRDELVRELCEASSDALALLRRIIEGKEWGAIEEYADKLDAALKKARGEQ